MALTLASLTNLATTRHVDVDFKTLDLNRAGPVAAELGIDEADLVSAVRKLRKTGFDAPAARAKQTQKLQGEPKAPARVPQGEVFDEAQREVEIALPRADREQLIEWYEGVPGKAAKVKSVPPGFEGKAQLRSFDMATTYARFAPDLQSARDVKAFYIEVTGFGGGIYGPIDPSQSTEMFEGGAPRRGGLA